MHKAILFDLGKVLVHFDFQKAYRELEPLCGYCAADIPKRLAGTGLVERLETGTIESREFVQAVCQVLDARVDYDEFGRIFAGIFGETLIPESLIEKLAQRYRLVLLSNTNAIHFELLRENYAHMLRHFHRLILSHEVGAMKPDPAIYRAAVEAAGCRPEECFYTDDILKFVEGGRALGIDAVQFESCQQLERELKARGMLED
jgi:putative hydrolase of the HAD superfamily